MKILSIDFYLNTSRPHATLWADDGNRYAVHPDGTTFVLLSDDLSLPAPGARFPGLSFQIAAWSYVLRNREKLFFSAAAIAGVLMVLTGLFLAYASYSPAGAEIVGNVFCTVFFWVFSILAVIPACLASALVLREFSGGISYTYVKPSGELKAGPVATFEIDPDTVVVWDGVETQSAFAERALEAAQMATAAKWTVVIEFRNPIITVFTGNGCSAMIERANPEFRTETWPKPDERYTHETVSQYHAYCSMLCYLLPEYLQVDKLRRAGEMAGAICLEGLKLKIETA